FAEGGVDEPLNLRNAAIALPQLQHAAAAALELSADARVGTDVGAAETIDRLLRVADDEQLAGHVVGEQQQDLGLDGIGVLELVDEDADELRLQMGANVGVRPDQIARLREQIGEVERAGGAFQRLIALGRAGRLLLPAVDEFGVRVAIERVELGKV